MNSILYIFLPCKQIYPVGCTYLADYIHKRRPEISQRILECSAFHFHVADFIYYYYIVLCCVVQASHDNALETFYVHVVFSHKRSVSTYNCERCGFPSLDIFDKEAFTNSVFLFHGRDETAHIHPFLQKCNC